MPDTVLSTSLLLICLIVATKLLESPHFIDEEPDPQWGSVVLDPTDTNWSVTFSKRGTGNLSGLEETYKVWRRLASGHFCAFHGVTQCLGPVEIEDRDWFLLSLPCLNFPLLYLWWYKYHRKYLLHSKRPVLLLNLTARVSNTPEFTKTLKMLSYCVLSLFV